MEHASHLVDLVSETGAVVGVKKRSEIDKLTDLYHAVFVVLCTPDGKLLLSEIPQRKDLPNLYAGKIGLTAGTIRRHNETPSEAASRVAKKELGIQNIHLTYVGENFLMLPDGHQRYISIYRALHALTNAFNHMDIESIDAFSKPELDDALKANPASFTPIFLAVWQKYQTELLPT